MAVGTKFLPRLVFLKAIEAESFTALWALAPELLPWQNVTSWRYANPLLLLV